MAYSRHAAFPPPFCADSHEDVLRKCCFDNILCSIPISGKVLYYLSIYPSYVTVVELFLLHFRASLKFKTIAFSAGVNIIMVERADKLFAYYIKYYINFRTILAARNCLLDIVIQIFEFHTASLICGSSTLTNVCFYQFTMRLYYPIYAFRRGKKIITTA